jgi:hypothetical protein
MSDMSDTGADRAERRWRTSLTVAGWLFSVQAGLGIALGLLSLAAAPSLASSLRTMQQLPLSDLGFQGNVAFDQLARQLTILTWLQVLASAVLLAGSVGLLRRQKWGWYSTVLLHVFIFAAGFFMLPGMLSPVLALLDPRGAGLSAWLITVLVALAPLSVVVFLLLAPVVRQFERGRDG